MKRQIVPFMDFSYTVDMKNYEDAKRKLQGGKKIKPNPFVKGMKEQTKEGHTK